MRLPGSGRVTYAALAPATEQLEVAARLRHGSLRFERGAQAHKVILHVAEHLDTRAQALRLGNVLKEAGIPVTVFGARETYHNKINADLGLPDDPATKALFEFLGKALKK